ncbi:putative uncharacterized protein [Prevotella sp. CAG:487]|nr:putative uncharacterized protein [Prevotella sp. CAG:487]
MALLPASCGDTMSEYSTYPCRFVFNTATHAHSAALGSAVGGTGIFCKVTTVIKGGARHYRFTTNQNMTDDVIFTAEDERVSVLLGMNNAIWFGYGNLDIPPVFYAYDAECPNCFNPNMVPVRSHPLSVASTGIATCGTCHREYNMNTGGNIVKGDKGSPLTRYHATYSPSGVVAVTN